MKVIMFAPAMVASAIGRMTCLVTKSLVSLGHEVVIVRAESEEFFDRPTHPFGVELLQWDDEVSVASAIRIADAVIYHIGDNYPYHEGCLKWMRAHPGIVCLHDFFVGHLFFAWAQKHREEADQALLKWYGEEGARTFFDPKVNPDFIARTIDIAPMTEWICSQAEAVVTHSKWGTPRAIKSCPGTVSVVPLAYDAPGRKFQEAAPSSTDDHTFKVLTIGHANANKRVASVIRAIASSPALRAKCVYRLVGRIEPAVVIQLSTLANSLQVNLVITGEVDENTLAVAIQEADVVSCLRWPSLEAASASAIESMLYGKATIVTDTGFYQELPSDCVLKISHVDEIENIKVALEQLLAEPSTRETLGAKARVWASANYAPEHYARALVEASQHCYQTRARAGAARYFERIMEQWGASNQLAGLGAAQFPSLTASGMPAVKT